MQPDPRLGLDFGDFYCELGVQCVRVCLATQVRRGVRAIAVVR